METYDELEASELLKVTDKVKVLPNKKYGVITKISFDGFIFLDHNDYRPYLPMQLEKVKDIPKIPRKDKRKKRNSIWRRFWFERPNTLTDEALSKDFFIGLPFVIGFSLLFWGSIFGLVFLFLSI